MLVKISTLYHGKYTSEPIFFVRIVLPEKVKHGNYSCASDSLLAFRLNWFIYQKVLQQLYSSQFLTTALPIDRQKQKGTKNMRNFF